MGNFAENLNLGNRFRPPPDLSIIKHYIIYLFIYMLAFQNNCFCFQVTSFYTKKVKFIQNVYKEGPLFDKKTYNWKTKAIVFKS